MKDDKLLQIEETLRQREKELFSIQKIGQALSSTLRLDDLLHLIMKEITEIMDADRSTLYLVDEEKKEIWSKIALKAEVKEIRQKFGVGISGYVAATGQTVNIVDAYQDKRFDPTIDKRTGYRTRSILCMPVWEPRGYAEKRRILGVVQVLNKKRGTFSKEDEGILAAICSQVAISLSNSRLYNELEKKYREIDLLYEFEQMISADFEVEQVFQDMLNYIANHLSSKKVGIIFPHQGQWKLMLWDSEGLLIRKNISLSDEVMKRIKANPSQINFPNQKKILLERFQIEDIDLSNVKFQIVQLVNSEYKYTIVFHESPLPDIHTLRGNNEKVLGILGQKIVRALELKELRESFLRQERLSAIGQMMSTIVHDLRSPLNSIQGFTELLLLDDVTREEIREYADIILMEIQSLSNMTTEILDFARGKTGILPRKCSVKEILKRFKPQAEQLFRNTKIEFQLQNSSKKYIYVDIDKCTRVLYNIAKNAKEAMLDEGRFICQVYDENNLVVFKLTDTGPGIPEEIKDRLFESFVTSGKEKGTGLGLAIVKRIVDDHRGKIEIESEKEKGTTFIIKFPVHQTGVNS